MTPATIKHMKQDSNVKIKTQEILERLDAGRWLQVAVSLPIIIINSNTNLLHRNVVRKANTLMLPFLQRQTTLSPILDVIVKNIPDLDS